jgi:hypothetical protein
MRRLDSPVRPGITVAEFRRLFVGCRCGLITTRAAFGEHVCLTEVIDLTKVIEVIDLTKSIEVIDLTESTEVIDLTGEN